METEIDFLKELQNSSDMGKKEKCDCGWCLRVAQLVTERIYEIEQGGKG